MRVRLFCAVLLTAGTTTGCGSPESSTSDAALAIDVMPDGTIHVDDGTPTRKPCTSTFGNALPSGYGRLDGYLVAIVQPSSGPCNADSDHVHLQVQMNSQIYDVAVNVGTTGGDVLTATREKTFLPWQEGWHELVSFDYVGIGLHKTDFTVGTKAMLAAQLTTELANVNHISVFATTYGPDGAHLVHRYGISRDGVIVTQPLSSPAHARMYAFSDQSF